MATVTLHIHQAWWLRYYWAGIVVMHEVTFGGMLGLDPASRQRLLGPKKKDGASDLADILSSA